MKSLTKELRKWYFNYKSDVLVFTNKMVIVLVTIWENAEKNPIYQHYINHKLSCPSNFDLLKK